MFDNGRDILADCVVCKTFLTLSIRRIQFYFCLITLLACESISKSPFFFLLECIVYAYLLAFHVFYFSETHTANDFQRLLVGQKKATFQCFCERIASINVKDPCKFNQFGLLIIFTFIETLGMLNCFTLNGGYFGLLST